MKRLKYRRPTAYSSFKHYKDIFRNTVVLVCVQVLVLMFFAASGVAEPAYVAQVSELSGSVFIERQGGKIAVAEGARLLVDDRIETGTDGAVGIIFNDETTLSIGPKTDITIQDYIFEPDTSNFSFIIKIVKGTATYVSGLIAKLSPESAKFITPSSTIGVRGTKFVIQVDGL